MTVTYKGPIAYLARATTDRRLVRSLRVPLGRQLPAVYGSLFGWIESVTPVLAYGRSDRVPWVRFDAVVSFDVPDLTALPPALGVGIDTSIRSSGTSPWPGADVMIDATLTGCHLYPDDGSVGPAWPDCVLERRP